MIGRNIDDGAPAFRKHVRQRFAGEIPALPLGGRKIALLSNVLIPAHTLAESTDPRQLDLCVGAVQIDGSALSLDDDEACAFGWHEAEFSDGRFSHRWTTGATPLPPGARIIVDLARIGYYWRASVQNAVALFA
jgi:hypothetical protein